MKRASPEGFLADSSLVPSSAPYCVDLSASNDPGASLFQIFWVNTWPCLSLCRLWSLDEKYPESLFRRRGVHGRHFHVFVAKMLALCLIPPESANVCSSSRSSDWGTGLPPVERASNDVFPHDNDKIAAPPGSVRGLVVGPRLPGLSSILLARALCRNRSFSYRKRAIKRRHAFFGPS